MGFRRSLSQYGGRSRTWGDADLARTMARCFSVEPEAQLRFTHGFHAYPGRMHPDVARQVLEAFAPKLRVIDPFVGSGTTAVEVLRRGVPFVGVDVSRVALEIAWTRTRVWVPSRCRCVEEAGGTIAKLARSHREESFPVPPWAEDEREWYHPQTLGEIGLLKLLIDEEKDDELRRALTCVLSSLMVKLSRQVSDSVTVPDAETRAWPRGAVFRLFGEKCADLTKGLLLLSSDLYKRGVKPVEPELRLADARQTDLPQADLVLTSPPYPGTYDYAAHHARRYALYGEGRELAETREIGSRRERARGYRADLTACLRKCLAASATVVLVIGDGRIGEAEVRADVLIRDVARDLGARVPAGASRRGVEWTHGRRGRPREEHLILVRRA